MEKLLVFIFALLFPMLLNAEDITLVQYVKLSGNNYTQEVKTAIQSMLEFHSDLECIGIERVEETKDSITFLYHFHKEENYGKL